MSNINKVEEIELIEIFFGNLSKEGSKDGGKDGGNDCITSFMDLTSVNASEYLLDAQQ